MKEIELNGLTNLEIVAGGTQEWYWSIDITGGDLYEAQQLFQKGEILCNHLYLIHYPDGKVYNNEALTAKGCYFGKPIYNNGFVIILQVDFIKKMIFLFRFEAVYNKAVKIIELPLCAIKDCYNLCLHKSPLMLTIQSSDNYFEIVWPEKVKFSIENRESFCFREENKLYFNVWYEQPEYREETVVRLLPEGNIVERFSGYIFVMPNGEKWHLK
ncbi:hypothetical protein FMM67_10030 [Clostridium sp. ASF356]|nr:hypothetical protein [Clostridium sp. MD294]